MASPKVFIGLLIGGSVSFLFSALAIRAVGRTAGVVVQEVRSQFADGGIMAGTKKPDYGPVIDICTAASLRELATPALLAVLTPVIVGFGINYLALGAFLAGVILTGQLMANFLSNSGGAWDNAKKYIEDGNEGGKGSEAHHAAVIGDTVGDPFKDTAGPALNPLIKVMNLVSLLILPAVISLRNDDIRYVIAGVALLVLIGAVAFSKRKGGAFGEESEQFVAAESQTGVRPAPLTDRGLREVGRRAAERGTELIGERDRDHPGLERHADHGIGVEHERSHLVAAAHDREADPERRERELAVGADPAVRALDPAGALEHRERRAGRLGLVPAPDKRHQSPVSSATATAISSWSLAPAATRSAIRRMLASSSRPRLASRRVRRACTASWPTARPIASRISVVSTSSDAGDAQRVERLGEEELVGDRGDDRAQRRGTAPAERRRPDDHEHEHERDVRVVDLAARTDHRGARSRSGEVRRSRRRSSTCRSSRLRAPASVSFMAHLQRRVLVSSVNPVERSKSATGDRQRAGARALGRHQGACSAGGTGRRTHSWTTTRDPAPRIPLGLPPGLGGGARRAGRRLARACSRFVTRSARPTRHSCSCWSS